MTKFYNELIVLQIICSGNEGLLSLNAKDS